jgi:hypothetical protein
MVGESGGESSFLGSDEIILVTGPHYWFHRGGVEEAVFDEPLIDVNPDHLAEGDKSSGGIAVDVIKAHGLQPLAFECTR